MNCPATEPTTRTETIRWTTSRTSIAPMALRRLRAMQADVGQAGRADRVGQADPVVRVAIVGQEVGAGAVDGVPADPVVRLRAAAETAKLLDRVL